MNTPVYWRLQEGRGEDVSEFGSSEQAKSGGWGGERTTFGVWASMGTSEVDVGGSNRASVRGCWAFRFLSEGRGVGVVSV